ncbi:MAG: Fic family protein [Candidatus Methanoplasma sp.]|nr:Fic family protein [Candidatus Methanoplasma sp.]
MSQSFDPSVLLDSLLLLPPRELVETRNVLNQCILSSRALSKLQGIGKIIPGLPVSISSLVIQEAKLSSEIENIVSTQDALFKAAAEIGSVTDPHVKEVLRYRTALKHGGGKVPSIALIKEICSIIMAEETGFRTKKDKVTLMSTVTREIVYTPPSHSAIGPLMKNLEEYILTDDIDPLIKMCIMHYQFEAIHPFHDGNGRTGRILNIIYLQYNKLIDIPVLYLSGYILRTKKEYYDLLRGVSENGAWEPWILYLLKGIEVTANNATDMIEKINKLFIDTTDECKKHKFYSKELVELIFRSPYCRASFLEDAGIAERHTATKYLKELESAGILECRKVGTDVVYINSALLKFLTA